MATKKETKEVEEVKVNEPEYPLADFVDNAKALGYKRYVVVGALHDCKKDKLTMAEFDSLINNFLSE